MRSKEDVDFLRSHLAMFLPVRSLPGLVGFLTGAQWADSAFLDRFQAFVSAELTGTLSLVWPAALCERALGAEASERVLQGAGTAEENDSAIEAVFDAITEYFMCKDEGRLDEVAARYVRMRGAGENVSDG